MKIHVYTICRNEEKLLPYYFRHYIDFIGVDFIYLYDNFSTDNTRTIISDWQNLHPNKIQLIDFNTNNEIRNDLYLEIKNKAWKQSRNTADYVIICDVDEFIFHENLHQFLEEKSAFDVFRCFGFQMFNQKFNFNSKEQLWNEIKTGERSKMYSKCAIFKPTINEINYHAGAHELLTIPQNLYTCKKNEIRLFHYRYIDFELIIEKNEIAKKRLSANDLKNKWGVQYIESKKDTEILFKNGIKNSVNVHEFDKMPLAGTIQHVNEFNALLNHIGNIDSFIEIGCYKGGSFREFAKKTSGKKISVDLSTGAFGGIGDFEAKKRNEALAKEFDNTHFIEGDTHKFETILKVKNLLGNEKVDFMFIDGDHTLNGVMADYLLFKQFVKQGGYIAFHDILNCELHRKLGHVVYALWNKFTSKDEKTEFISKNNDDVSFDVQNLGETRFGGIGVIKNNFNRNVHIFQVFYDEISMQNCLNQVENYLPNLILNTDNVLFENAVIERIYNEFKFKENDYIGVTSPRLYEKSKVTIDLLVSKCTGVGDIINYSPKPYNGWGVYDDKRVENPKFFEAAKELNESKVLDSDLFESEPANCFCNYWIAKNFVFKKYCKNYLLPAIKFFRKLNKWTKWNDNVNGLFYREKWYPMAVFILEGLFGSFLSNERKKGIY